MKIKTPKQIINKKYGKKGIEPMMLTLFVDEIVKLMKAYHNQFKPKN